MGRVRMAGLPDAIGAAVRSVLAETTELDVTVAGPGDQALAPFLEIRQEEWERAVDGLRVAFGAVRAAAADGSARIVLVSHPAAVRPIERACLGAVTGAFLHTLAQVAAVELGPSGVTANAVAPGFAGDARFDAETPRGSTVTAGEVAAVVAFLASPAAAGVNGAVVTVDGGLMVTKSEGANPLAAE